MKSRRWSSGQQVDDDEEDVEDVELLLLDVELVEELDDDVVELVVVLEDELVVVVEVIPVSVKS